MLHISVQVNVLSSAAELKGSGAEEERNKSPTPPCQCGPNTTALIFVDNITPSIDYFHSHQLGFLLVIG